MALKINGTTVVDDNRVATVNGLSVTGTGAAQLPSGTTAQRPDATIGSIRFNTDTATWELVKQGEGPEWAEISFKGENLENTFITGSIISESTIQNSTVTRVTVGASVNSIANLGALTNIGMSNNYYIKTISSNTTFTFSAPGPGAFSFLLELTHTSGTVTWPASVRWPGGVVPTLTTGKTHLFVFVTDDNGTTWRGASSVDYTN
jgi:hypothetical protein